MKTKIGLMNHIRTIGGGGRYRYAIDDGRFVHSDKEVNVGESGSLLSKYASKDSVIIKKVETYEEINLPFRDLDHERLEASLTYVPLAGEFLSDLVEVLNSLFLEENRRF